MLLFNLNYGFRLSNDSMTHGDPLEIGQADLWAEEPHTSQRCHHIRCGAVDMHGVHYLCWPVLGEGQHRNPRRLQMPRSRRVGWASTHYSLCQIRWLQHRSTSAERNGRRSKVPKVEEIALWLEPPVHLLSLVRPIHTPAPQEVEAQQSFGGQCPAREGNLIRAEKLSQWPMQSAVQYQNVRIQKNKSLNGNGGRFPSDCDLLRAEAKPRDNGILPLDAGFRLTITWERVGIELQRRWESEVTPNREQLAVYRVENTDFSTANLQSTVRGHVAENTGIPSATEESVSQRWSDLIV